MEERRQLQGPAQGHVLHAGHQQGAEEGRPHSSLAEQFAAYSAATRAPSLTFSEGAAQDYPVKPLGGQAALAAGKKKTFKTKLDHLTSATFQFVPGGGTSKLKLRSRWPPSPRARARSWPSTAPTARSQFKNVKVNRRGVGKKKVAFDGTVVAVEVTLVNASTRYRDCYRRDTPLRCSGRPVDDNLKAQVQGKAS